jgi:hypothetical protein
VRLQLAQEAEDADRARRRANNDQSADEDDEDVQKKEDTGVMHPSLFISAGVQLEEDQ